ncbi:26S proteasome regulatory subunit RPN1 [Mycena indigotica]|uniref:26S proteasome regulatory subunit RPN1 n=1 Tax=Mycena indigotica TaxID=2126181 RepID=A0A8H6WID9_9AGAR|nr:26S proteasome regulatory subunit RPN1 [Mycena indigotica]KAF7316023.1 26S proteasome regulatory subunit RPN1 [Mycena indigotica]
MPNGPIEIAILQVVARRDFTTNRASKNTDKKTGSPNLSKDKRKDGEKRGEDLSEEDQQFSLERLAGRLNESNADLYKPALEILRFLIRTSTSSIASVPKPLKVLHPLYPDLQALYETWEPSENKSLFADILWVLVMAYSDTQPRGTLCFCLLAAKMRPTVSPLSDLGSRRHEYVRHLAGELGNEDNTREQEDNEVEPVKGSLPVLKVPGTIDDLRALAKECAVFLLDHNGEPDAIDLLQELEIVEESIVLVDKNTYTRVCQYFIGCVNLLPPSDDIAFLRPAHAIYVRQSKFPETLALAIRLGDQNLIQQDFNTPSNPWMMIQLASILARAQLSIKWLRANPDNDIDIEDEFPEHIRQCLNNIHICVNSGKNSVLQMRRATKKHFENTRPNALANVDSARGNLAGSFVNALVNARYDNKLMVEAEEGNSQVYKNKAHGKLSAAASLSISLLWDTEVDLSHIDKYAYSSEEYIKAGSLLATGTLNSGVRTEADVAKDLIRECVDNKFIPLKTSAIVVLGLAYAGAHRQDLLELLLQLRLLMNGSNSLNATIKPTS